MRPVSIKLKDMAIANIQLGFVGENNATQVIFDCKEIFDENPYAVQLLVVTPPEGTSYEVTTARIGDNVVWDVSELDTAYAGDGSIQLVFTDGSQVIKTYNADTTVLESQVPSGTAPATALNWIQDAEAWAKGTRGGRAVESDDPTYQNNSKYYSDKIVGQAEDSEAYAAGTRNGEPVESDDPAYHNNSKYYAESIEDDASDSEAYAAGTRGGEAVDEDDPAYHNNASYYNDQAALEAATAAAAAATASAAYNVNLLAPNYTDLTFPVKKGQPCIYSGGYYEALVDIATTEEWTSAHWKNTKVGAEVNNLKSAIENVYGGTTYNLYRCINKTQTINGVKITTDIANNVIVSGTGSANGGRTLLQFGSTTFPAGTYYFSVTTLGSPTVSPILTDSTMTTVIYSGTSFTLAEETDLYLVFNVVKNTTYNQNFRVQVAVTQGAEIIPPITAVDKMARMEIEAIESEISPRSIIVDANGGGDYTSLSAAVQYAYAQGNYTIYVKSGTYNILNELDFTDKTSLPGYGEGNNNAWGLKIGNNMRIICENNVVFSGLYDGTDFDIKTRFSMFNVTGNYELENMEIVIQNLRYCIHEDTPTLSLNQAYTSKIKNCRMRHKGGYTTSACLGCGDANNSLTIIEGGEYQSDDYDYPITMHNHTGNKDGRIIVDGVYIAGTGTVRLAGLSGTSSGDTLYAMVRNCRLGANVYLDLETSKINLIQFGNTIG